MITVTVTDRRGNYVMGLTREAFNILDEKDARAIESFENADSPISIGMLVDTSESMQFYETKDIGRAGPAGDALLRFVQLGHAKNEYFVLAFDAKPRFLTDWKSGQELLTNRVNLTKEKSNTAFYDSCFAALEKLKTAKNPKRAILIITDGQDNVSGHTFTQLRNELKAADVLLYAVGVSLGADVGSSLGIEGFSILTELTSITGGEAVFPRDQKQLRKAVESFAIELRHQYRMGFSAAEARPPNKWHRLKVKVTVPPNTPPELKKVTVRSRQGYYTP